MFGKLAGDKFQIEPIPVFSVYDLTLQGFLNVSKFIPFSVLWSFINYFH